MRKMFLALSLFLLMGKNVALGDVQRISVTQEIAKMAYIYGFPLVLMEVTKENSLQQAPVNVFVHLRSFPNAAFEDIVAPSVDTLYSSAWLDLTKEPIFLNLPDTDGRYYLMELLDAWTNVFASLGSRTTGNEKRTFAIVGPNWKGELPSDVKEIRAPTDMVWILGRINLKGRLDYSKAEKLQDQYVLTPMSAWEKPETPKIYSYKPVGDKVKPALERVSAMDSATFFTQLSELVKKNPPPKQDEEIVKKCASIGIVTSGEFDPKKIAESEWKKITHGVVAAKRLLKHEWETQIFAKKVNGWTVAPGPLGKYGTNYEIRAVMAFGGLGANLSEDLLDPVARVDGQGLALSGEYLYKIHFAKGELPPVNGFWSITLYNEEQFFVPNRLDRYSIGDLDNLKLNPDGSLDIYVQKTKPGKEKESNWLPAPAGYFHLIMRLYWPKEAALTQKWNPPPVLRRS